MSTLTAVKFQPGITPDDTYSSAEGRWVDGDKVRFVRGQPQLFGGWERVSLTAVSGGPPRGLHGWADLSGNTYVAAGSAGALVAYQGAGQTVITPTNRATGTLGSNPFSMTNTSATVTVTHANHGANISETVTFSGASAAGGITISGTYTIVTLVDANSYTITHGSAATSTTTGGGASVAYTYPFPSGRIDGTGGGGYGTGYYGSGTYGSSSGTGDYFPTTWSLDNFGSDLVAMPRRGQLYKWTPASGSLAALVSNAPSIGGTMFVSPQDHVVICGATDTAGSGTYDPMLVAWCDQRNITTWTSTAANQAGTFRLGQGSRIIRGLAARSVNLLWTDTTLYGMSFTGDNSVYGFKSLGPDCGLIGPNAAAVLGDMALWVSNTGNIFMWQGGAPVSVECPLQRYLFDNIAYVQQDKIFVVPLGTWNEFLIAWPDQRDGTNEISRYAIWNYQDNTWSIGTFTRTAWIDAGPTLYPVAADSTGYLYYHEKGQSADGGVITGYVQSAPLDVADGDSLMWLDRVVPDFAGMVGGVSLSLRTWSYPQATAASKGPYSIVPTTKKVDFRAIGRQIALRIDNAGTPSFWRLGSLRIGVSPTKSKR